jgi:hydrogenase maturation protease
MQKILIYGVGNPYRCDDTVGLRVVEQLKDVVKNSHITIASGSTDGLTVLDEIVGFDRVIFIDSIKTEHGNPGDTYKIKVDPFEKNPRLSVSHGIDFVTALRLGRQLGYIMPNSIDIYAIEIEDNTSFGEECTERVNASIPKVVAKIVEDIQK